MKLRNVPKVKADNPDHQKYMDWIDLYYKEKVILNKKIFAVIELQFPELHDDPELVDKINKEWRLKKFGKKKS